jgi:hypothetical protein
MLSAHPRAAASNLGNALLLLSLKKRTDAASVMLRRTTTHSQRRREGLETRMPLPHHHQVSLPRLQLLLLVLPLPRPPPESNSSPALAHLMPTAAQHAAGSHLENVLDLSLLKRGMEAVDLATLNRMMLLLKL